MTATVTVTADLTISLDGYIASTYNPAGDGAEPFFEWIHNLASWRERQGMTGGEENRDSEPHRPRPALVKEGGTTFTFVIDGIHSALDRRRPSPGAGTSTSRAVPRRCGSA